MIRLVRGSIDLYAGLLLVMTALCGIWLVSDLDLGTAREMGPAYFPLMIAAILGAMGLVMIGRGLLAAGPAVDNFELRPLAFVVLSFVCFGALVVPAGLIVAILAQVAIAHFASPDNRPLESLFSGLVLAAFSAVLFVLLLRIPVRLVPAGLLP